MPGQQKLIASVNGITATTTVDVAYPAGARRAATFLVNVTQVNGGNWTCSALANLDMSQNTRNFVVATVTGLTGTGLSALALQGEFTASSSSSVPEVQQVLFTEVGTELTGLIADVYAIYAD